MQCQSGGGVAASTLTMSTMTDTTTMATLVDVVMVRSLQHVDMGMDGGDVDVYRQHHCGLHRDFGP